MTFFLAPGETAEEFLASREAILNSEPAYREAAALMRDKSLFGTAFIDKATGKRIPPTQVRDDGDWPSGIDYEKWAPIAQPSPRSAFADPLNLPDDDDGITQTRVTQPCIIELRSEALDEDDGV